jgi:hypothetical protein
MKVETYTTNESNISGKLTLSYLYPVYLASLGILGLTVLIWIKLSTSLNQTLATFTKIETDEVVYIEETQRMEVFFTVLIYVLCFIFLTLKVVLIVVMDKPLYDLVK